MRLQSTWAWALGLALVLGGASAAQAVGIKVHRMDNAKLTRVDDNTVVFTSTGGGKSNAVFDVLVDEATELAEVTVVKRRGNTAVYERDLKEDGVRFVMKDIRRVVVKTGGGKKVPEPGVAWLVALTAGGLAIARRRR